MTEPIILALIAASGPITVAVIGVVVGPIVSARLKSIQEQVANDHRLPDGSPLNLRDDLDTKHDENKTIAQETRAAVLAVQRDVAWIMRRQADTDDRVDALEDTITKGTT